MHMVILSKGKLLPAYEQTIPDPQDAFSRDMLERDMRSAMERNAVAAGIEDFEVRLIASPEEYRELQDAIGAEPEEVEAYCRDMIGKRYPIDVQMELLEDTSSDEAQEMIAFKRAVKAKATGIKAMKPIPLDFRDVKYWE